MGTTASIELVLLELERANSLDGIQRCSEAVRDHYGIDHIAYHWVDSAGDQYGCGTYSIAWQEKYIAENYLRVDPVIAGCYQRFHPCDWKAFDWSSKAARDFQAVAATYGIGNQGFSVPIRGPNGQFAIFTVNHNCDDAAWAQFTEENRRELILIAHFFNEKALELEPDRTPEPAQQLSPREVDAMTLLAIGYNRAQVANSLSISEHTLRVYIESARFKLGALNTTHAVARALSRGLIVV
ncbi:autoinducer binding domain-containing protein [Sulfitobacter albidus]|uniref:Autoinducer binding domain-containing protein n=1 Tax=Sulfitobacter albidus TaxID=2829501 RepID=A0A975JED8_9RHOB|nr:autoinducer binding domain-containing protein [Sulfitobacter albidus]QUJ76903.1 autoinducer binding domain-containing protein [Sulfitobacter albidus]